MAKAEKAIKVCLVNRGADSETPWAHDLGPAPGPAPKGSRKVRIVNVPFLHAKPTWGDVVVVSPAADGVLTWDRGGVEWAKIATRILEDGGRWAMIVDYSPAGGADADGAFAALVGACERADIVCEGAWGPKPGQSGRAYLAVRDDMMAEEVMEGLLASALPCVLTQVHPAPVAVVAAKAKAGKAEKAVANNAKPAPVAKAKAEAGKPVAAKAEKPVAAKAEKPVAAKAEKPVAAKAEKPAAKAAPVKPASKAAPVKPAAGARTASARVAKAAAAKAAPVVKSGGKPAAKHRAAPVAARPGKRT